MPKTFDSSHEVRALTRGALALRFLVAFLLAASLFLVGTPAFAEPERDADAAAEAVPALAEESLIEVETEELNDDESGISFQDEAIFAAGDYVPTGNEITVSAVLDQYLTTTDLQPTVTYDPSFEKGKKTRFTFAVPNTTKSVWYKVDGLKVLTSNGWSSVLDTSNTNKFGFGDTNYLEEEIVAAGTYRLTFYVWTFMVDDEGNKKFDSYIRFRHDFTVTESSEIPSVDTCVSQIAAECQSACSAAGDTSDYAKALWLNDWIVDNTSYDWSGDYISAEGVFTRGTGTCEGYHEAYSMLLNKVGIETRRVHSLGKDNHVWTGAKLDGQWYHIDTTWNDGYQAEGYPDAKRLYFALPNSIIKNVHSDWDGTYFIALANTPVFEANAYDDNYFIKSGEIDQYTQPYLNDTSGTYSVKSHLAAKEASFSVPIVHTEWAGDADKYVIYGLVAHVLENTAWGDKIKATVNYDRSSDSLVFTVDYDAQTTSAGGSGDSGNTGTGSGDQNSGNTGTQGGSQGSSGANQGGSSDVNQGSQAVVPGSAPENAINASGKWVKQGGRWWYSYDGATQASQGKPWPAGEWVNIGGKLYCFDSAGWMIANWNKQGSDWYWHGSDGAMKTGWIKTGGKWYWLRPADGKMATSWITDAGKRYWLNSNGAMQTNWGWVDNSWYWFGSDGAAKTGWIKTGGKWYWLNSDNRMATGWVNDRGTWYWLEGSGAMATGWRFIGSDWYYFNGSGAMRTNAWAGNYYLNADGKMAVNTWIGKWHVGADGKWDATR